MLTTIVVFSSVALSQPTADSISVASATGENGQTIQVPVNITNVANGPLQVIMFDVTYDSGVIELVKAKRGSDLPTDEGDPMWAVSLGTDKKSITISTNSKDYALSNGTTGNIAKLHFNVTGTAGQQTNMNLTSIDVSSTDLVHGTIPSINGTFMVTGDVPTTGDVVINEFVSDNTTEWVELYNNDTEPVNLTDWTLEDGGSHVKSLSGIIPADGYLVFGPYTTWLNNPGDVIYLNNTTANIDKVAYGNWDDGDAADNAPVPTTGESAGRFPNGNDTDVDVDDFRIFGNPTPGAVNTVTVVTDTEAPSTSGHVPAADATDVPIDTNITVHVLDDGDGVNISTIVMTVNGTVVTPDITGASADYTLVYDPAADFGYDQLVNVTINASDLNGTPNVMTMDEYSFTTGSAPATYPTADSISVASATGENGQTIQVPVNITNVANGPLQVIMFDVTYDSGVIELVKAKRGSDLPTDEGDPMWAVSLGTDKKSITISTNSKDYALSNGTTGNIAKLHFNVTGTAGQQTNMNLTSIDVSSTDLVHGTIPSINGTFTVTGDELPALTVTADPTSVIKDTATDVTFNVTSGGSPVDGALVTLLGCGVDTSGTTGADGIANISVTANDTGAIGVTATKTGYDEATTTVDVTVTVSGGSGSGGSGSGTYPPGWGEPAPTSAATPAPTAAPEPTVAPTKAPTVAPTEAPTKAPTVAATEIATTEMQTTGIPGFGAVLTVFAIAGLLVAAYLVMRRRE